MIAKTIHYIWLGDHHALSGLKQRCIQSWKTYLADFNVLFWDENKLRHCFDAQQLVFFEHMLHKKKYAFAADYARCLILQTQGGIYLDTDVEIIRDLTPLLQHHTFLGLEDVNRPNCAVLGTVAGSPFISQLKQAVENANGLMEIPCLARQVLSAGKNMTMDYQYPVLIDNVLVCPERYFYPYNPYKKQAIRQLMYSDIQQDTYAIHHWDKSWKLSFIERLQRFIKYKL